MSFLKMLLGLALMLLGIYFLSKNIFITTNVSPYWWRGISADLSILSLVVGIVMIVMIPGVAKYLGWGLVGFGIVLVFASSRAILNPTSLWQFFVATFSFVAGYKLMAGKRMSF